jgi:hypothetical protein
MSKNPKESKRLQSVEVAALDPASDELVEVQALRQVNTTLYGNIREGKRGKVSAAMAAQLEEQGEVIIVK